jgi:hypothetical protein
LFLFYCLSFINVPFLLAAQREGPDTIEALLYLAHYWKGLGRMAEAEEACLRLLDFAGRVRRTLGNVV